MMEHFCNAVCGEQPSNLYSAAKDFQTFGAAILALIAALVTYISTQRAANKQRRTALEIDRNQRNKGILESEAARIREAVGVLLAVSVDIGKIEKRLLSRQQACIAIGRGASATGSMLRNVNLPAIWQQAFADNDAWEAEFVLFDFDIERYSKLDADDQFNVYLVATSIKEQITCVNLMNFAREKSGGEWISSEDLAVMAAKIDESLRCISEVSPSLFKKGKMLRAEQDRIRLQTSTLAST